MWAQARGAGQRWSTPPNRPLRRSWPRRMPRKVTARRFTTRTLTNSGR
jgi:hypothetical protein